MNIWLPPVAFVLDRLFADSAPFPHPVQGIGSLANKLERVFRPLLPPLLAGGFAAIGLILVVGGIAFILCNLPGVLGVAAGLYLSWSGLALEGLLREGKKALHAIRLAETSGGQVGPLLDEARYSVQMLVSRDTSNMDVADLYRSLAESVSENFNDAFVAPWFWLCLTGPVGMWMYKAASTLDSMWGYTTTPWLYFGRFAARLDDAFAFIPARLSAALLWLGTWIQNWKKYARTAVRPDGTSWPGFGKVRMDAKRSTSPNAGWPMAAAAWLFNGRNGGPTAYHGKLVEKPLMGPQGGCWHFNNTAALIEHIRFSGMVCALISLPLLALISLLF